MADGGRPPEKSGNMQTGAVVNPAIREEMKITQNFVVQMAHGTMSAIMILK
jgi:hypothetical protein